MAPCSTATASPEAIGFGVFVLCGLLLAIGWFARCVWEHTLERLAQQRAWDNIQAAHQRAVDRNADLIRRQMAKDHEARKARVDASLARERTVHSRHLGIQQHTSANL